jgi:guanosine-3',5'-bis(diphosphate) 3'-pyrophosphohydrolase
LAHVRTGTRAAQDPAVLRLEEEQSSAKIGQEILEREVKRRRLAKLDESQLDAIAHTLGLNDAHHVIASIGQGDINVTQVLKLLYPELESPEHSPRPTAIERLMDRVRGTSKGVKIQGADGLMVRYAQCCQPVPGDPVVGYVTRGRGVSIHRADCPNLLQLIHEPERRLEIDWQEQPGERFLVRLAIEANDRRSLYADIAAAVSSTGTDIRTLELKSVDGRVTGAAVVEVENLSHLQKILKAVRRVKGISDVARREHIQTQGVTAVGRSWRRRGRGLSRRVSGLPEENPIVLDCPHVFARRLPPRIAVCPRG